MPRHGISLAQRQEGLCDSDQGKERPVSVVNNQDDWVFKKKDWTPRLSKGECTVCHELDHSITCHQFSD